MLCHATCLHLKTKLTHRPKSAGPLLQAPSSCAASLPAPASLLLTPRLISVAAAASASVERPFRLRPPDFEARSEGPASDGSVVRVDEGGASRRRRPRHCDRACSGSASRPQRVNRDRIAVADARAQDRPESFRTSRTGRRELVNDAASGRLRPVGTNPSHALQRYSESSFT